MGSISDNGRLNLNVCVAMTIVATLAVIMRFGIRVKYRLPLGAADWLCLLGLFIFLGYIGVMIAYITHKPGVGEFDFALMTTMDSMIYMAKMLFATEILFTLNITAVKLSLIVFYNTLFSVKKWFKWAMFGSSAVCVSWCIIFIFLLIFQCDPVAAKWELLANEKYCMSTSKLLLGYEMSNLFLDVLVLCLPIGMLHQLQLPGHRKASIGGIFLLGAFVCVASILRIRYIYPPENPTVANIPLVMVWSTVQLGVAIVCSCLPTYGPLFRSVKPAAVSSFRALYPSQRRAGGSQGHSSHSAAHLSPSPYYKIDGDRTALNSGYARGGQYPMGTLSKHSEDKSVATERYHEV